MSYLNTNKENLSDLDREVSQLAAAKRKAEDERDRMQNTIRQLEEKINNLQREAQNGSDAAESMIRELSDTKQLLQQSLEAHDRLQADYAKANATLRRCKQDQECGREEVNRFREINREHAESIRNLENKLENQKRRLEQLERELEQERSRRCDVGHFLLIGLAAFTLVGIGLALIFLFSAVVGGAVAAVGVFIGIITMIVGYIQNR